MQVLTHEALAKILVKHIPDLTFKAGSDIVQDILNFQDSFVTPVEEYAAQPTSDAAHAWLTNFAKNNSAIVEYAANNQKIHAIKELRTLTNAGLKEAKDAVEAAYNWSTVFRTY